MTSDVGEGPGAETAMKVKRGVSWRVNWSVKGRASMVHHLILLLGDGLLEGVYMRSERLLSFAN